MTKADLNTLIAAHKRTPQRVPAYAVAIGLLLNRGPDGPKPTPKEFAGMIGVTYDAACRTLKDAREFITSLPTTSVGRSPESTDHLGRSEPTTSVGDCRPPRSVGVGDPPTTSVGLMDANYRPPRSVEPTTSVGNRPPRSAPPYHPPCITPPSGEVLHHQHHPDGADGEIEPFADPAPPPIGGMPNPAGRDSAEAIALAEKFAGCGVTPNEPRMGYGEVARKLCGEYPAEWVEIAMTCHLELWGKTPGYPNLARTLRQWRSEGRVASGFAKAFRPDPRPERSPLGPARPSPGRDAGPAYDPVDQIMAALEGLD